MKTDDALADAVAEKTIEQNAAEARDFERRVTALQLAIRSAAPGTEMGKIVDGAIRYDAFLAGRLPTVTLQ